MMNRRNAHTLVLAGGLAWLALASGCGKSNPAAPVDNSVSQQNADDAAQQVALTMAQGNGGSPAAGAPGASSAAPAQPGRASLQAAQLDTTFTAGHVTWTLTRTWFDSTGAQVASYSPASTVRMVATARGVGAIEAGSDTASFGSAGTLDVHGIAAWQDTLNTNANRADTLQAAFTPLLRGGRTNVYTVSTANWSDVLQVKPVDANPWPLSGTATWTLHVSRLRSSNRGDVASTYDAVVTVTFNGTRYPDVVVSGGFHYTFDLVTGAIARR